MRDRSRKHRDDAGREHTRDHAAADPPVAAGHGARHREHDADNQAGLEDFAENDDQRGKHEDLPRYFTTSAPRATFSLYSSKNS